MTNLPIDLACGHAVVHWLVTECSETPYAGIPRDMTGGAAKPEFSYEFVNGFVDTGNLPCRERWLYQTATDKSWPHELASDLAFTSVYCANGSNLIDFSAFRYLPTLSQRYLRCNIHAGAPVSARFRLTTCGIVRIWCNQNPVNETRVQRRNHDSSAEIEIELAQGANEITLQLEELHERDTRCFFNLTLLAGDGLSVSWTGDLQPRLVDAWATFQGLNIDSIVHTSGTVDLQLLHIPEFPMCLTLESIKPSERGGLWTLCPDAISESTKFSLECGVEKLTVAAIVDLPVGSIELLIKTEVAGYTLVKRLGLVTLQQGISIEADSIRARKQQGLDAIMCEPGHDPGTALALLHASHTTSTDSIARNIADSLIEASIMTIENRFDCSDFNLLPLLKIWEMQDRLSTPVRLRLRDAILNYRYWLDEPGNDVMWFWSENHALCFHVAQAIAGQLFPEDHFRNSDSLGTTVQALGEKRLRLWFDAVEVNGLAEFNSAAYYPIDLLALLTLYDSGVDSDLRRRARQLLDQIFIMVALHTSAGVPAGAQGRAYEKEILAGNATELGSVVSIAFGGTWMPGYDRAAALFCLSGYEPPAKTLSLARPAVEVVISAQYRQGGGSGGALTLWKCAAVQLSSASGYPPGERGHQQHLLDVQFAGHAAARFWINHPGDDVPWGEQRPSCLAGNLCLPQIRQHRCSAMMIYDLEKYWNPFRYINLYVPETALCVEQHEHWLILSCGEGYVGVWCSSLAVCGSRLVVEVASTEQKVSAINNVAVGGGLQDKKINSAIWQVIGEHVGIFVTVGSAQQDSSLNDFRSKCLASQIVFDPCGLRLQAKSTDENMMLDFAGNFTCNDVAVVETNTDLSPCYALGDELPRKWNDDSQA